MAPDAQCPCESEIAFQLCCAPLLEQKESAATAEALMRSRYTAYVLHNSTYLLHTWHPRTRPKQVEFDEQQRWLGLKIKHTNRGAEADQSGRVEFVARYKLQGRGFRLHEDSYFERQNGHWVYVDGRILSSGHLSS